MLFCGRMVIFQLDKQPLAPSAYSTVHSAPSSLPPSRCLRLRCLPLPSPSPPPPAPALAAMPSSATDHPQASPSRGGGARPGSSWSPPRRLWRHSSLIATASYWSQRTSIARPTTTRSRTLGCAARRPPPTRCTGTRLSTTNYRTASAEGSPRCGGTCASLRYGIA